MRGCALWPFEASAACAAGPRSCDVLSPVAPDIFAAEGDGGTRELAAERVVLSLPFTMLPPAR